MEISKKMLLFEEYQERFEIDDVLYSESAVEPNFKCGEYEFILRNKPVLLKMSFLLKYFRIIPYFNE